MKTTTQIARDISRLESERSFRTTVVYIEAISPDQTRATVRSQSESKRVNSFTTRIILTPGLTFPIDASNYMGLLHGDPKAPIGVQLFPKAVPQANVRHAIPRSLYGAPGNKKETPVDGRHEVAENGVEQQINLREFARGHGMVVKPPKMIPRTHIGNNEVSIDDPRDLIDDKTAFLFVGEEEFRLVADEQTGIVGDPYTGISLYGNINIGTSIEDVRIGGAWRFNPMHRYQIPSTAVTPQPLLVWDPPASKLTRGLKEDMDGIRNTSL